MIITSRKSKTLSVIAGAMVAVSASFAHAQDLAGKTVEFVIPFSEAGGSARWANFFAPLLSEALPGKPTVVVRYRPGAGSTEGANWFQGQTTADGTLLFGTSGSTQFPYLLGDPRVRYEYADWQPVLASGTGGVVFLPPDLGAKFDGDFDDLASENFLYGSQGATTLDLVPLLAFKMLGLQVDPVFGLEGRGDGRLMFERGEANIDYQTSSAYIASVIPLVEQNLAVPAFSFGALDENGVIGRDPTFPDIPSFREVCEATAACVAEGVEWEAWKAFFISGFAAQKMVYLPNAAPQEVVDMYTQAFRDIVARPDFVALAEAELGAYPQLTGDAGRSASDQATKVAPESREFVLKWLGEAYGVTMK
jgi:tripartite-type tricarboxylate transporter receptor subunit TctC